MMGVALAVIAIFSGLAFWKENALVFMVLGGASLMTGLRWFDVYNNEMGLGISLMLIAYSLLCLGLAFRCLFWRDSVSG